MYEDMYDHFGTVSVGGQWEVFQIFPESKDLSMKTIARFGEYEEAVDYMEHKYRELAVSQFLATV